MKLYTEEEVRKAIIEAMFYHNTVDSHISNMTPIELPSDEDIQNNAEQFEYTDGIYGFKQGVKWVTDKIKNQQ